MRQPYLASFFRRLQHRQDAFEGGHAPPAVVGDWPVLEERLVHLLQLGAAPALNSLDRLET
jgi:hypothetical protein